MSAAALKWARAQTFATWRHKSVLMAVAWFADAKGAAWPSQESLSAQTGMSVRSVRRALSELESLGVISRKARGGRAGRISDLIVLALHLKFAFERPKRVRRSNQQPAKFALLTGQPVRGIVREQQIELSQRRTNSELVVGDTHEQRPIGWQPVVVTGGRS